MLSGPWSLKNLDQRLVSLFDSGCRGGKGLGPADGGSDSERRGSRRWVNGLLEGSNPGSGFWIKERLQFVSLLMGSEILRKIWHSLQKHDHERRQVERVGAGKIRVDDPMASGFEQKW